MTDITKYTVALIKPDAQERKHEMISKILEKFKIVKTKEIEGNCNWNDFYENIKSKSFYKDYVEFMSSGKITAMILEAKSEEEGHTWIQFRNFIGSTDPKKADPGTIRAIFGKSVDLNAVHGSSSLQDVEREVLILFPEFLQ